MILHQPASFGRVALPNRRDDATMGVERLIAGPLHLPRVALRLFEMRLPERVLVDLDVRFEEQPAVRGVRQYAVELTIRRR